MKLSAILKEELKSAESLYESEAAKGRKAKTSLEVNGAVVATLSRIVRAAEKWEMKG